MNIRAINLTQALLQSSKSLFAKDGSLTWFKGDTHWNKQGIGVAAKVLCNNVEIFNCNPST